MDPANSPLVAADTGFSVAFSQPVDTKTLANAIRLDLPVQGTVSVASTTMPVRLKVAKPASETVTVYRPAGSNGTVKRPASVVTVSDATPVPSLVTTTVAPGITAFCGSVTVPVTVADRICADAVDVQSRPTKTNSRQRR